MSKSRRTRYSQMPLPFDQAELRQRVRPVAPIFDAGPMLPPGLRDFAREANLTDAQTQQLAQAWGTIRGQRPATVEEWRTFCTAIKAYLWGDNHADPQTQS